MSLGDYMNYYLGIDGGGTKTKVIIIDQTEKILFENTSGPSSVDTVDLETTYQNILKAISPFVEKKPIMFSGIFAGLGGIVFDEQKKKVVDKLYTLSCVNKETKIVCENDMYNALYSGLHFDEGMGLICGTGMVAFGKNVNGKTHKAGGWGYKEGEMGSGYHLGKEAISYAIRCYDGRLPMDDFARKIADSIGMKVATDIIPILDELHTNRTKVASLAPLVREYAELGHTYALQIMDRASTELALAVKAVYTSLGLKKSTLVVVGSLGNVDGPLKKMLHKKIHDISQDIEIIAPKVDPALAAALMASKLK